jgi:aspartyl-tRNA(Asn)/glutamyl-tRNA(Gln) amidotransferase subunit A
MTDAVPTRVADIVEAVTHGRLSAREVVESCLTRIAEGNEGIGAFVTVDREGALARADEVDRRVREAGGELPLAGVPIGVKDNILTRDLRTTAGSRILENLVPPHSATVVERLETAGAVVVGKTNLDEFAMGSTTDTSIFGPTRNPVDRDRTAGGSSGGSAAAVGADLVPAALGSDTGGSIRQPAAFTGVVGLKPTYGRVSRYGLIAFGSSLDQIGPFGRSIDDVERVFSAIAGHDPKDSTSSREPVRGAVLPERPVRALKGLRVGWPAEYFSEGLDRGVAEILGAVRDRMASAGAEIVDLSLPHTGYAIAAYYVIAPAEASSNLSRYDGIRYGRQAADADTLDDLYLRTRSEGFGDEVKRRILLGTFVLSSGYYDAYYLQAQRVRRRITEDFERAFESVDVLLTPTTPTPAFRLDEKPSDPLSLYLADVYTVAPSLAGVPALSVPAANAPGGLPVGAQLIAPWFREDRLLAVGAGLESLGTMGTGA